MRFWFRGGTYERELFFDRKILAEKLIIAVEEHRAPAVPPVMYAASAA